jgi:hypothetical protein
MKIKESSRFLEKAAQKLLRLWASGAEPRAKKIRRDRVSQRKQSRSDKFV